MAQLWAQAGDRSIERSAAQLGWYQHPVQKPFPSTCTGDFKSIVQNRDENPRMRKIFNSKSPPKVRACADSRRDFRTTDRGLEISSSTKN